MRRPSNENKKILAQEENKLDGSNKTKVEASYYSAPLPHPDMMEHYERIHPGSADRIIKSFEKQGEHRHKCEKIFIYTQSIKSVGGLLFGFIIAMSAILGGIYTAIESNVVLGGSLSFTGLAILVGAFIVDKVYIKREEEE